MTDQDTDLAPTPICDYCEEPAVSVVQPEEGEDFYVCEDHEERGILDSGSGFISPLAD